MKFQFSTILAFAVLVGTFVTGAVEFSNEYSHQTSTKSEQCGGVIEGSSGTIEYVHTKNHPTQCVWTIQAIGPRRLTYSTTYTYEDGNLDQSDLLSLTAVRMNFNMAPGQVNPYHIIIDTSVKNTTYQTGEYIPVGFSVLIFRTNSSRIDSKHFRFSYQAEEEFDPSYPHYNYVTSEDSGTIRYPHDSNENPTYRHDDLATFVVSNEHFSRRSLDNILLQIDFAEIQYCGGEAFYVNTKCNCDGVTVFEILPEIGLCSFCREEWEKTFILKKLDNEVCGYGGGYGYYSNHGFLIAFVTDRFDSDKENRPGVGFSFNWKNLNRPSNIPSTTEMTGTPAPIVPIPGAQTSCGGLLESPSGYIEYKLNQNYTSNEFCVWTIRCELCNRISFAKEISGLIVGEDLITVTMIRAFHTVHAGQQVTTTVQLNEKYDGPEAFNLYGSVAIIVFTSNAVNEGQGFRLKYTGYKDGFKYTREYTDVGEYGAAGEFGHGPAFEFLLSSFVVAPNLTRPFDHVSLTLKELDVHDSGTCNLNVLFLYEILPSSSNSSQAGHIQEIAKLCQRLQGLNFSAERGFFGLLVTTKRWQPINGYTFNYSVVEKSGATFVQ